jgi:hypothetical protein
MLHERVTTMTFDVKTKETCLELIGLFCSLQKSYSANPLSLEQDIERPEVSDLFRAYPNVLADQVLTAFICDTLKILISVTLSPEDLSELLTEDRRSNRDSYARAIQVSAVGLVAMAKSFSPGVVAEYVRRSMPLSVRPSFEEVVKYVGTISLKRALNPQDIVYDSLPWDDFPKMSREHMSLVLKELPYSTVLSALVGSSKEIVESICSSMNQRAAEELREDLGGIDPIKQSEVNAARQVFLEGVVSLESQGKIPIQKEDSDLITGLS